jgi:hypothetical protein
MKQNTSASLESSTARKITAAGKQHVHLKREWLICLGWLRLLKAIASDELSTH